MPLYTFRDEDGNKVELMFSFSQARELWDTWEGTLEWEGQTLTRDIASDIGKQTHGDIWAGGLYSECVAVDPSQVAEAEAESVKRGVPTHYRPTGEPVFTSESHRRKFIKAFDYEDRKSYG